jgi:CelD/BcsL family acetyltransferase involved in cellulose biosynthesis
MENTPVKTRVLEGFDDPTFGPDRWEQLLRAGGTDSVYLTWQCQRSWWETLGRGSLLLIVAEQDGRVVALAPFYHEAGMVYFVGSSFELDWLDFIGDVSQPPVLDALLETARAHVPGFLGFELLFVPDSSGTGARLQEAGDRLGLFSYAQDEMLAPALDLAGHEVDVTKKSLLRYERRLERQGRLEVQHLQDGEMILPHLDEFIAQHIARWQGRDNPSRFLYAKSRAFLERLTRLAGRTGRLRFTRLDWQGRALAFHYGLCYRRRFFWGPASFNIELAHYSPGQVLLRQLLLAAIDEGASTFDFGTGDAAFKRRFATEVRCLRTWGLYPNDETSPRALATVPMEVQQ